MKLALHLGSLLAVVAFVGGVTATWASLTDEATATGTVSAGTVDIKLTLSPTGPAQDDIQFFWNCAAAGNLAQGDTCSSGGIGVRNTGTLAFTYDFGLLVIPESLEHCFDVTTSFVSDTDGGTPQQMPPGDEETIALDLAVVGGNECMGETAEVGVTITATQASEALGTED